MEEDRETQCGGAKEPIKSYGDNYTFEMPSKGDTKRGDNDRKGRSSKIRGFIHPPFVGRRSKGNMGWGKK